MNSLQWIYKTQNEIVISVETLDVLMDFIFDLKLVSEPMIAINHLAHV